MKQIIFKNRLEFKNWLIENVDSEEGIWLVFSKQKPSNTIKANEALEEALCYGWIDGQLQSIDDNSYIKYFKQREKNSNWSERNKKIAEKLEQKNIMTDFGREKIKDAKQNGKWELQKSTTITEDQMQEFENMLIPFDNAYANFVNMSQSVRKTYTASYFYGAKTLEGKKKRFNTIIERLNMNLNPMESIKKKL